MENKRQKLQYCRTAPSGKFVFPLDEWCDMPEDGSLEFIGQFLQITDRNDFSAQMSKFNEQLDACSKLQEQGLSCKLNKAKSSLLAIVSNLIISAKADFANDILEGKIILRTVPVVTEISRQFRRKRADGKWSFGLGSWSHWEELPDETDWEFLDQFMTDYDHSDEAMWLDDFESIIRGDHDYKDLQWLHANYPHCSEFTMDDLKAEHEKLSHKLFKEAKDNFTKALNSRKIQVRQFPVTIVSATSCKFADDTRIWLQHADRSCSNFGSEFYISYIYLQNVKSRTITNDKAEDQFQVYCKIQKYGLNCWCNANKEDFE